MSKNWIKGLKRNKGPRALPEIQQEYGRLASQAGQAQYQVFTYTNELERLNKQMLAINNEAAERITLDKEAEANKPKEEAK